MTAVPNPFDITVKTTSDPPSVRVQLAGEFDGSAVQAFDTIVTRIVDLEGQSVTVDIENVTLLDSAGIGALMRLRAIVQSRQFSFTLLAPQPFQQRLFSITGLAHVLAPVDSAKDSKADD